MLVGSPETTCARRLGVGYWDEEDAGRSRQRFAVLTCPPFGSRPECFGAVPYPVIDAALDIPARAAPHVPNYMRPAATFPMI